MLKIIAIVILTWISVSFGLVVLLYFFSSWLGGGEMLRTYEVQDGKVYLYYDGHLTHILHDSPNLREDLAKHGYKQHNKWQRNGRHNVQG